MTGHANGIRESEHIYRLPDEYRQLLRQHCCSFDRPLASGAMRPTTDAQLHFVAVCEGRLPPRTVHEFAYTTFKKICSLSGLSEDEVVAGDFFLRAESPAIQIHEAPASSQSPGYSGEFCPRCAKKGIRSPLVWRHARDPNLPGEFLGCSSFPHCRYKEK